MMKFRPLRGLVLIAATLPLMACKTASLEPFHDLGEVTSDQVAIVVSKCDKVCKAAIEHDGEFKRASTVFFGTAVVVPTVQSVNGIKGETNNYNDCQGTSQFNVINSSWDWSFELELAPGENALVLYPQDCNLVRPKEFQLVVNLEAGQKYALASVQKKNKEAKRYELYWYPALYNIGTGAVVIGQSKNGWLGH